MPDQAMTCAATGKRIYTRKESMAVAAWWRRVRFARMNHFQCKKCGGWHIGNAKATIKRKRW